MTFYCRQHLEFEGLDLGDLHDHLDKEHRDIYTAQGGLKKFFAENIEITDFRRSDAYPFQRTWGRPPSVGQTH